MSFSLTDPYRFFLFLFLGLFSVFEKGHAASPNFVIFIADDLGINDLGLTNPRMHTPHLDRLANEGAWLKPFYSMPWCTATRVALLTGTHPSAFGVFANEHPYPNSAAIPLRATTIPKSLSDAGYESHMIGKWHVGETLGSSPLVYGFRSAYGFLHGQIDHYRHTTSNGEPSWFKNGKLVDVEGHATDLIADEAIRLIETTTNPFMLWVAFSAPHYPLQAPDRWLELYDDEVDPDRRIFSAMVSHLDDSIGRIVESLKNQRIYDSTLILFMSDNGGQENWFSNSRYNGRFGPYKRLGDNSPFRGWKGDLYEGGINIPAILRLPSGLSTNSPRWVLDIKPMLERLAGLSISSAEEGPLWWQLKHSSAIRVGPWKLIRREPIVPLWPDNLLRWPLPWPAAEFELYNLVDDPEEKHNLVSDQPDVVKKLARSLNRRIQ